LQTQDLLQTTIVQNVLPFVQDLFDMDQNEESLHLQHLLHPLVQQTSGLPTDSINGTDIPNLDGGKGRGRRRRRGRKGLGNRMYCKNSFDSSPDCLNAYYTKLDDNNEMEWALALDNWWWNQMKLAWFGWLFIPMAGFMGVAQLIFPDLKPDIDNAPWRDRESPLTSKYYSYYSYVSQMSEPNLFFLT
jgi:hypothetical protein